MVGVDRAQIFPFGARQGEQAVVNRQLRRPDDGEAARHDEVIYLVDRAGGGVLHRQDAVSGLTAFDRLHHIGKAGHKEGAGIGGTGGGKEEPRRLIGISPRPPGADDPPRPVEHRLPRRVRNGAAQGFARGQPPVLKGAGNVHHGGEYHGGGARIARPLIVQCGGVPPHLVEHLALPFLVKHRELVRRLVIRHPEGAVHPAAEQFGELPVERVDFGAYILKIHRSSSRLSQSSL